MNEYPTQNIELCAKDEEIAQLKNELSQELSTSQRLHSELMESAENGFKKDAEIERLKALIRRAAVVLEGFIGETGLVAELRKAAER